MREALKLTGTQRKILREGIIGAYPNPVDDGGGRWGVGGRGEDCSLWRDCWFVRSSLASRPDELKHIKLQDFMNNY